MPDRKDSKLIEAGNVSRRNMLKLATGAAGFTFLQRRADALPIQASRFVDHIALERIADRDTNMQPQRLAL